MSQLTTQPATRFTPSLKRAALFETEGEAQCLADRFPRGEVLYQTGQGSSRDSGYLVWIGTHQKWLAA
jgi:hypothetical protein